MDYSCFAKHCIPCAYNDIWDADNCCTYVETLNKVSNTVYFMALYYIRFHQNCGKGNQDESVGKATCWKLLDTH